MSGIPRRAITDGAITPKKLDQQAQGRYFFLKDGHKNVPITLGASGAALSTGLDESGAIVDFGGGNPRVVLNYQGAATSLGPVLEGGGADDILVTLDATNAEGALYTWGNSIPSAYIGQDGGGFNYTVGTSPSMFIRAKLKATTVANTGELAVGFTKPLEAAGLTLPDDFTDAAFLNCIAGDHNVETILNNAATESTDTAVNAANGTVFEYKVVLDNKLGAGRPRFFVDGVEFYPTTQFAFDSADVVIPFLLVKNAAAATTQMYVTELEIGVLEDVDDYLVW